VPRRSWWRSRRSGGAPVVQRLLAGVVPVDGNIQPRTGTSTWSTREDKDMSVRCARERGRCQGRRKGGEGSGLTGIVGEPWRCLRDGMLDFAQPGGRERGKRGVGEREDRAAFIGAGVR
jgi:hypothetical protein